MSSSLSGADEQAVECDNDGAAWNCPDLAPVFVMPAKPCCARKQASAIGRPRKDERASPIRERSGGIVVARPVCATVQAEFDPPP
jgi:hypothetical protein